MVEVKRNKLLVLIVLSFLLLIVVLLFLVTRGSKAEVIENDTRLANNSDLVYYLDVIYDGIDKDVKISSDNATSKVYSDYIYVEDRLPEGLDFVRFVTASDGTVGATKRSDNSACQGYVVGNKNGLKYDKVTKKVSFKIKNLQAGCKLTVGIVTRTPKVLRNDRMDFYNTVSLKEKDTFLYSNLEHVYVGKEKPLYEVNYKYVGDVPTNVSSAPDGFGYSEGSIVEVLGNIKVDGYTFKGWESDDVEVINNTFVMPKRSVTFIGKFIKDEKYNLKYEIIGDRPDNYKVPSDKEYYSNSDVILDSLSKGDVIDEYVFNGWELSSTCGNINVIDNSFVMPDCSVTVTGSFIKKKYLVRYRFRGDVIPSNYLELLPEDKYYYKGEKVKRVANPHADGYKFLGWLSDKEFEVTENTVIYGQWMKLYGYFTPNIKIDIINNKEFYHNNDIVNFKVTVKNNDYFNINDIMVKSKLNDFKFINGNDYKVLNDNNVKITNIDPYKEVYVYGKYKIKDELSKRDINQVEITGGIANDNYYLNDKIKYKDSVIFNTSNINLIINNVDDENNKAKGGKYSLYSGDQLSLPIDEGLIFSNLMPDTTYYLRQDTNPDGFMKNSEVYKINIDNKGDLRVDNYKVSLDDNTYTLNLVNQKVNLLPQAGGIGVFPYILSGLIIVIIGFVLFIFNYKEEKVVEEIEVI